MPPTQGIDLDSRILDRAALQTVAVHGRPALAWEVLRRDLRYKETFEQVRAQSRPGLAAVSDIATRWGLHFR